MRGTEESIEQRWVAAVELLAALGEEQNLESFGEQALAPVLVVLDADAAALYFATPDGLALQTQRGFPPELFGEQASLSLDSASIAGQATASGALELATHSGSPAGGRKGAGAARHDHGLAILGAVPLRARGELVGALTFGARRPRHFGRSELAIVHFVAHAMATTVLNLRAAEAEHRMRVAFQAMDAATLGIAAEIDPASVLEAIVAKACQVTGARYGAMGIGTDATKQFEPWVSSGIGEEEARRIGRHPRPVGLLGAVPAQNKIIRLPDVEADPRFRGWPEHHPIVKSFLGVPVRAGGEAIGNLYLGDKGGGMEFTAEDEQAVASLAAHAAIAYRHARLYDDVQTERNRLQAVVESSPLGIVILDAASRGFFANRAAEALWGRRVAPEGGREQYLSDFGHPDGRPYTLEELPGSRALRGETVIGTEVIVRRPDGQEVPLLASAEPIRDGRGAVTGAVVVWQDMTPFKLEQLREEFISLVVHELRAPITTVAGYADLLSRKVTGAGEQRATDNILASARRLERLVQDLLDISRIEARQVELEKRPLDLSTLAEEVVERLSAVMAGHPVRLSRAESPPVLADAGRIEQVLTNLLTNAAKYSPPESEVRVVVEEQPGEVVVSVSNEGPGIAAEEMPRLFTRFFRTLSAQRGKAQGLGLGLYIARGLVEAHGGRIWATTTPGHGATFCFALPVVGE